jgi:hypothetical protein
MRGPTAVGTACVSRSWTILYQQVGAKIRNRKILPVLDRFRANPQGLGGLGSNQQTSLLRPRAGKPKAQKERTLPSLKRCTRSERGTRRKKKERKKSLIQGH